MEAGRRPDPIRYTPERLTAEPPLTFAFVRLACLRKSHSGSAWNRAIMKTTICAISLAVVVWLDCVPGSIFVGNNTAMLPEDTRT